MGNDYKIVGVDWARRPDRGLDIKVKLQPSQTVQGVLDKMRKLPDYQFGCVGPIINENGAIIGYTEPRVIEVPNGK